MHPTQKAIAIATGLLVGVVACLEVGYRIGRSRSKQQPGLFHEGIGTMEAAIFALLGLLLGFSFAGGMSRLETRRQLIIREANAIGTAYLRLDLIPVSAQPDLRRLFREYIDVRLGAYGRLPDMEAADQEFARAAQLQQKIWSGAVTAGRDDPTQNADRMLLPALNEMIDITTDRAVAIHTHLPPLIFILLVSVALLSGLVAGYAMARRQSRSLLHMLVYAAAVAVTVYAIVDLDNPRSGLIRLDAADNALVKLRDSIL